MSSSSPSAPSEAFWKKKWETGDTQFHQMKPHTLLVQHFHGTSPQKILVPLCGKSLDLLWLAQQGHRVVGAELSSLACEAFFKENQLTFKTTSHGIFTLYEGDQISLWCGDFFKLPPEAWHGITAVYDRAALIALPSDIRRSFVRHIASECHFKRPDAQGKSLSRQILLITIEYPDEGIQGPPFSVPEKEVQELYDPHFYIEKVSAHRDDSLSGRGPKFAGIEVIEKAFRLTAKP